MSQKNNFAFWSKLVYIAFFLSGFAGLGYQIVWTRAFSLGLGHEMPALLAVVGAFFGGLAIGAGTLDKKICCSRNPGKWFAGLELLAGFWSLVTIPLIPFVNANLGNLLGPTPSAATHWFMAFIIPFFILLPATLAMGATLPAIDRFLGNINKEGLSLPGLYSVNTAGAALGILASIFLLLSSIGFNASIVVLACCDFISAAIILILSTQTISTIDKEKKNSNVKKPITELTKQHIFIVLFFTGLLGIAYEILVVRMMIQVLENTIYSYASAIFVYLFGTALGAAVYQKKFTRQAGSKEILFYLLMGLSTACSIGLIFLSQASHIYNAGLILIGRSVFGSILSEIILAIFGFLLPTFFMGMIFSHLAQAVRTDRGGVGYAFAVNTFGGSLAAPIFGVLLLPFIGLKFSFIIVITGYLFLLPYLSKKNRGFLILPLAFIVLASFLNLRLVRPGKGGKIIAYKEGIMASVAVSTDTDGERSLKVNNQFTMGGTGASKSARSMAAIPVFLHPDPQTALFLGLGPGITLGTVAMHPGIQGDGVELVPEVIELMPYFTPDNFNPTEHKSMQIYEADARRFVKTTKKLYDVIVADLYQPARDGAGALYTIEHFKAIKARLQKPQKTNPNGGIFCQWLPLHQMDLDTLSLIGRTFLRVFPNTHMFIGNFNTVTPTIAFVGTKSNQLIFKSEYFQNRLNQDGLKELISHLDFEQGIFSMLRHYLAGPQAVKDFCGKGDINTDNRPIVTWRAPKVIYNEHADGGSQTRLHELIDKLARLRQEKIPLIDFQPDTEKGNLERKNALSLLTARDLYFIGCVIAEKDKKQWGSAINFLVKSIRLYPDFNYSYTALINMAEINYADAPDNSYNILKKMVEIDPQKQKARLLLKKFFNE